MGFAVSVTKSGKFHNQIQLNGLQVRRGQSDVSN